MLKGKKMKALNLEIEGYNNKTIAEMIGVSEPTLISWQKKADYKEEYSKRATELITDTTERIRGASKKALDRLLELVDSENERISLAACNSILDRAIGKAKETVSISADIQQRPLQSISEEQLKKMIEEDEQ